MQIHLVMKHIMRIIMFVVIAIVVAGCNYNTYKVIVKGQDGALLKNATVNIGDTTGKTDQNGLVTLNVLATKEKEVVVSISEKGFVDQVVVAKSNTKFSTVQVMLQPVKEVISIENIDRAQTINGETLGAKIILQANALVKPNGQLAEGNVTLNLTPWDIQSGELRAMPGNGQAIDSRNRRIELISAGMMSIDFYNSQGERLQLAQNTTAEIQMNLTQTSINNQALSVGDTIPLWHFDETRGLWVQEGVGTVIASDTSSTGMALSATVKHFSTWNWDFKFENAGSVDVKCQLADGTAVECSVVAQVTLDDGSHFTKSNEIPVEGLHVINMPSSGSITWMGSTLTGLIATTTSGTTGNVIIVMAAPTTKNFIQCDINGTAVACKAILGNPSGTDLIFSIPAEGAKIVTAIENVTSLSWMGTSNKMIENNQIVYYTGNVVSNTSDSVSLHLNTKVEVGTAVNAVKLTCVNTTLSNVSSCNITVSGKREETVAEFTNVPIGGYAVFEIPAGIDPEDNFYINANARDENNEYLYGYQYLQYQNISNGQLIQIELSIN